MSVSRAMINPARGSVVVTIGSTDEGVDLPTHHLIAPWPVDEYCQQIAAETLAGMGWQVIEQGSIAGVKNDADPTFVLDVAPAPRPS